MSSKETIASDPLLQVSPSQDILIAIGLVSQAWSNLDAVASAAIVALLKIDPVEAVILLGKVEAQAKIGKMAKILEHRRDKNRQGVMKRALKTLEKLRPPRNALTHGFYLGTSDRNEHFWVLSADVVINSGGAGTELYATTIVEIVSHAKQVNDIITEIVGAFEPQDLQELFLLPSHVRI